MSEQTFEVVKLVVSVVATLVGLYLIPYIHRKTQELKQNEIAAEVETAVRAVEQTVKGSLKGKVKKADVIKYMTKWLNDKNIKITAAQLDILIESAVYYMNKGV
jgi:LL-H family phage holin